MIRDEIALTAVLREAAAAGMPVGRRVAMRRSARQMHKLSGHRSKAGYARLILEAWSTGQERGHALHPARHHPGPRRRGGCPEGLT